MKLPAPFNIRKKGFQMILKCVTCGKEFNRNRPDRPVPRQPYCSENCRRNKLLNYERRIQKTKSCWIWTGALTAAGYGLMTTESKNRLAHRFAFEKANGPIPEGLYVCHHCDNPACCNPDHLFLGTHKDNQEDAAKKLRLPHKLIPEDVRRIRIMIANGVPQKTIASIHSVTKYAIYSIQHGLTWNHVA